MMKQGTEVVKALVGRGGMKKEEEAEEEAGLGSEQVSQVLYIHPVGVYPLSLCVSFGGGQ